MTEGVASLAEWRMWARNWKHARMIPVMASTVAKQPKMMVNIFSVIAQFSGLLSFR
jgi:hypothetical protein